MITDQNCAKTEFFIFCPKIQKNAKAIALAYFPPQKTFSSELNGNCSQGAFGRANHSARIGLELARFLFEIKPPQGAQSCFALEVA